MVEQSTSDPGNLFQRLRVGLTGLAVVVLLIVIAGVIYRSTTADVAPEVIGQADPQIVANITAPPENSAEALAKDEPLAEIGVAPSAKKDQAEAAPTPAIPQ